MLDSLREQLYPCLLVTKMEIFKVVHQTLINTEIFCLGFIGNESSRSSEEIIEFFADCKKTTFYNNVKENSLILMLSLFGSMQGILYGRTIHLQRGVCLMKNRLRQ